MTEIKTGDTVMYKGGTGTTYEVWGVHGAYVWLPPERGATVPCTGLARHVEKVTPFFEAGKTYASRADSRDIRRYRCIATEVEPEGNKVAFGRYISSWGGKIVEYCALMTQNNYDNQQWYPVGESDEAE